MGKAELRVNQSCKTVLHEVTLHPEKAGEKICTQGLDNSGNIEGILNALFSPRHRQPSPSRASAPAARQPCRPPAGRRTAAAWPCGQAWSHECCQYSPDQLKFVAMLPFHDVNLACQELVRCVKELGAVAGSFSFPIRPCTRACCAPAMCCTSRGQRSRLLSMRHGHAVCQRS
jgi:hypothetical protein